MNYYPFHIGDYASATRHLSWDEDCAYRRLLDTYYTTEKPLPLEMRAVCRLAMAHTEAQREAVQVVLDEFFEQTPDGWVNSRADAEIDSMRVKQSAQDDKAKHETDRMRRYRERRAAMFEQLRAVDVVPAWDVPMKELQRLIDAHCNAPATPPATNQPEPAMPPETHLQREQVISGNAPATAISTNTNTNTNTNKEEGEPRKRSTPTTTAARPDDVAEPVWQDFQRLRREKRAPLTDTALAGVRREADKAGIPLESAIAYCCEVGWQGFNAGWYAERNGAGGGRGAAETAYQRSMRERMQEAAPAIARKAPGAPVAMDATEFFNTVEAAPALRIGAAA